MTDVDHYYMPRHEQDDLKKTLNSVVEWIADDLDLVITRQTRYGASPDKISQGRNRETPIPYQATASDAASDLTGTLQAWVDHVATHRNVEWPGMLRAKAAATWLSARIVYLALCEGAEAATDEITDATARAARICDRPKFRRYQGSCEVCEADLWASTTDDKIVCAACKHVVEKEDNDRRIDAALEARSYTANELVEIVRDRMGLAIKPKTIHDMAYRRADPILVRGRTYDRQKLYNAGDVFSRLRSRKVASA